MSERIVFNGLVLPEGVTPLPDDDPRAIEMNKNLLQLHKDLERELPAARERLRIMRAKSWNLAMRTVIG